ncbi:hypothetical protein DMN91_010470 [Ooceraea biroi]|uniref:NADH dehydrogenase [ubiquinone] 1 alpha subcomplex assembly factor n=1 Tax=Ooceraea biroi TaxID=2015173 RepID=A0A026WTU7_OOCBI|nr:NADH dehydrogenase [ubiquinone] 1 alpha subcomplex assembly factor 3 [Ooceraea biroi]EZA59485.1 NADH dehydrogenase [ubiquinone] 1 alpha subcomplex assembly factor [Ooceraea biroi]RLU16402.1 hypothetical protein DMN91_010470 [Ooceraea biroi]
MNVTYKLCQLRQPLRNFRNLHTTRLLKNSYEGPGKTTITFISKEMGTRLLISKYDKDGFVFNTGARVIGPTVLFPRYAIGWNVYSGKDINEEALSLFTVLEPKPDVLIFGLEDAYHFAYYRKLQELVKKLDITAEILSVRQACVAYNFMNEDGRDVVAALIPPTEQFVKLLPKTESREQITDSR